MYSSKRIVCSISNAKKLHELGILQGSIFYFVNNWKNPIGQNITI